MENVSIIAFYSFFRIDNLELLENQIQDYFQPIDIKGTVPVSYTHLTLPTTYSV